MEWPNADANIIKNGLRCLLSLGLILSLDGCNRAPSAYQPGQNHPANPSAAPAPEPMRSTTLRIDPKQVPGEPSAMPAMTSGEPGSMDNESRAEEKEPPKGHDHGNAPADTHKAEGSQQALFSCPMHPEIRQAQSGKCPKCGMKLEPVSSSPDEK